MLGAPSNLAWTRPDRRIPTTARYQQLPYGERSSFRSPSRRLAKDMVVWRATNWRRDSGRLSVLIGELQAHSPDDEATAGRSGIGYGLGNITPARK
jgi:hypothetical protein